MQNKFIQIVIFMRLLKLRNFHSLYILPLYHFIDFCINLFKKINKSLIMFNIQFEGTTNYPNPTHTVKDMVKLFDIKPNDFNNTISTVNSDSYYSEKNSKILNKQDSDNFNNKNIAKNVLDPLQSSVFVIDQDHYEIFDPVYPSMTNIFKQKIKKKSCSKPSLKTNNIKTLSNLNQNKYNNNHIINNYFNYLWQVGDEFSEIHCFPLF